mmetsp:Transcript_59690/g.142028  ORF Transcript_59690/g.142028 Transcript_59690/m.142028 type:complete len:519 (+) Transcript_59690:51-1607(+)|eukprot:CAMPEP_0178439880 /NCGR_PEP_ID=MMETSP0689_2-20121128/36428_1 /TAXON_ID=160604 /ORGANISM="Amphidinium massartii, Strain CS-259" /LENGTH=518 /DNA_ID=CAMNT_0020062511 /DNA_START=41 /DNA_END=1597 /DNA_ORIENTATION=-
MSPFVVLVGNLPGDVQKDELTYVFQTYGEVTGIEVFPGSDASTAHVSYKEQRSASDAIEVLNGQYKIRTDAPQAISVSLAQVGGDPAAGAGASAPPAGPAPTPHHSESGGGHGRHSDGDLPKVFAGGLPEDISEEELRTVFGTYGEVAKIVITKANMSGVRGALIFYNQRDHGEVAIKMLHGQYRIRQDAPNPIQVTWARDGGGGGGKGDAPPPRQQFQQDPGHKLFIGSLPGDISEDELRTVFGTYGVVNAVKIFAPQNKSGMKAAFVIYAEKYSADDAIGLLHNQYKIRADAPEPIQVKMAHDQGPKGGKGYGGKDDGGAAWGAPPPAPSYGADPYGAPPMQPHPGFDPQQYPAAGPGYGAPEWGQPPPMGYPPADPYGAAGGYGAPPGSDPYGAAAGGGYGPAPGGAGGGRGPGYEGLPPDEQPTGKLYVSNLPEDIPEDDVRYVFGTYGRLTRCHLLRSKSVNGCIAAFVDMETPDQAIMAIEALNRKYEIRAGYGAIGVRHASAKPPGRSRPY